MKRIFISKTTAFAAVCLMAVCSCVKEQLPTGGFGRGYIEPTVSFAGEMTKSSGTSPEGRYMGSYAMEGVGSDSLYISVYEYDNTDLPYGMTEEEEPQTKGKVVTTDSINVTGTQFTINAWLESVNRYDGTQNDDGRVYITSDKDNWHIMNNVIVERDASGWIYANGLEYPWRNQVKTNFWSYYYKGNTIGHQIFYPGSTATDEEQKHLTIHYAMALPAPVAGSTFDDAVRQGDLCIAYNTKTWEDGDDNKINIEFHHALSAVYFSVADVIDGVTVKQIGLDDILSTGWCDVTGNSNNTPSFVWRDLYVRRNYLQDYDSTSDFSDSGRTQPFYDNEKIFTVLPQELGDSTCLRAKFELSDGSTATRTVNISKFSDGTSVEWKPGKKYLYKLRANNIDFDYTLSIDRDTVSVITKNDGNWKPLYITSYKVKKGGTTKEPVQWFLNSYSLDKGATWNNYVLSAPVPDTLLWNTPRGYYEAGVGGENNYVVMAPASARYEDHWTEYTTELRTRSLSPWGTPTDPWDLSTHDFNGDGRAMCTANCYVVDRAGYYMLPLVYGPSIYNGSSVPSCYQEAFVTRGTEYMTHLGAQIVSPYIYNNGFSLKEATLVYQDKENLIDPTTVSLTPDHHYLRFKVNAEGIEQGNAIVAVTDSEDNICWSWHIWVTAEDYTETHPLGSATAAGSPFTTDFSTLNLGTVRPPKEREYFGRELWIRFRQDETGQMDTVVVMQEPLIEKEITTNSLYQWGRKDPMLRANGAEATERHCYTAQGEDSGPYRFHTNPGAAVSIADAIMNPNVFYISGGNGWVTDCLFKFPTLWNNGVNPLQTDDSHVTVKTVYDPCPVGFSVPTAHSGRGLLKDHGATSTNPSVFNGHFDDEAFIADTDDGQHLKFEYSGYREYNGDFGGVGACGQWWTSDRYSNIPSSSFSNPWSFAVYKANYEGNQQITISGSMMTPNAYSIRPAKYEPPILTGGDFNDYDDKGNKDITF